MKTKLFVCLLAAMSLSAWGQDALEFQRQQSAYRSALQRATRPLTQAYIQELSRLRDTYLAANRSVEAQQVENEIKLMTDKLAAVDSGAVIPGPRRSLADTGVVSSAPNPAPSLNGHRAVILDSRVKVPSNSPDGYPLGAVRKGDLITLQYLEGLWKAHGHVASDNPDAVREERNHQDESRLVIARASSKGKAGGVIALVPPLTSKTPFAFPVPESRDDLVLRINKNSESKENPGVVTYQLKITR